MGISISDNEGPIKCVQIYNLMPSLDPGILSMRERKERWKKHR